MRQRVSIFVVLLLGVGFAAPSFADGVINLQTVKRGDQLRVPAGQTGVRVLVPPKTQIDRAMPAGRHVRMGAELRAASVAKTRRGETKELTLTPGRYSMGRNGIVAIMRDFEVVQ
jgi:hypothetical protein